MLAKTVRRLALVCRFLRLTSVAVSGTALPGGPPLPSLDHLSCVDLVQAFMPHPVALIV